MSISLRSNADGSGTLLNGSTPVMEITAAGVVSLPNIAAGSSANQPVNFGQFIGTNVSLSGNGYQKLPSGLIIQWGYTTTGGATFPVAFPNSCLRVLPQVTSYNSTGAFAANYVYLASKTTTNFTLGGSSVGVDWIAIGY